MTPFAILLAGIVLAGLLGFSAHRAGVCTVKEVAEIMSTRRAHMLAGFARAALWVMVTTGALGLAFGAGAIPAPAIDLSASALMGGFVFGMGAALNAAASSRP